MSINACRRGFNLVETPQPMQVLSPQPQLPTPPRKHSVFPPPPISTLADGDRTFSEPESISPAFGTRPRHAMAHYNQMMPGGYFPNPKSHLYSGPISISPYPGTCRLSVPNSVPVPRDQSQRTPTMQSPASLALAGTSQPTKYIQ